MALYSVWEIGPDKRKWGIRGEGDRTLLTYPGYSRPAHFPSRVAGSGDIVHRPDYTPNHQRSQLGALPRRIVGVSMTNGTRHNPCLPRHWAMRCPAWTLTRTSHNKVVNKIRPNTDVASISSVLHLVWPLAQSLSSMVVPTRSQNSSWHSLCDLRGTQAPQLRQSTTNTLGGFISQDHMHHNRSLVSRAVLEGLQGCVSAIEGVFECIWCSFTMNFAKELFFWPRRWH